MTLVTRPKLLIADDSVTIRKVVELTFVDEGIDVTAVGTAQEAMERFVDLQPDIVLVDVGLEGTNGYQICSMIKQDEQTKDIPVLLLVGSFEPFDQDEAEHAGADGFVTKPFHSIRDLVGKVSDLLNGDAHAVTIASSAPAKVAFAPDTEDIDHLYQSSLAETVEIEQFETMDTLFDHDGFDDEMIETVRPDDGQEESQATTEEIPLDEAITEEDVDVAPDIAEEPSAAVETGAQLLDPPPVEPETTAAETEPAFEPKFSFSETEPEPIHEFASTSEVEVEGLEGPGHSIESAVVTEPEAEPVAVEYDEPESAIAGSDAFAELATETPDREDFTQASQDEDCYPTIGQQEWEPSSEMIAEIVQKVVERMSDRVVRDIAQDAVPRIAEKLIREALDEGRKD